MKIEPADYRVIQEISGKKLNCITNLDLKIKYSRVTASKIILKLMKGGK